MASYSQKEFGDILANADLSGFTHLLKGNLKRYIVGLTNNQERNLAMLTRQAAFFDGLFTSVTV